MATATARIHARIVATDGLGAKVEFLPELVLRAVRMVLLTELAALREVMGCPTPQRRAAANRGRFRDVHDLTAFVHEELDQITRAWSGHRDRPWADRLAFRAGVYAAARAVQRLGRVPDLVSFLCEGGQRSDWPELAEICTRIRAAFDIGIAVKSDRPFLLHAQRLHDLNVAEHI
jgi:hypothetical protein